MYRKFIGTRRIKMSEVITFINMKGGVGKTTLAVNVAYTLSKIEGKKVLLIDMDPQMNATQYTLTESQMNEILEDRNKSVYGCLSPDYQANSVLDGYEQRKEEKWIFNVENTFDIIPSSLDIMTLNLAASPYKLKQYIQNDLGEKYDIVTSRAVAPLKHLLEYSVPLVKINGYILQ